MNVVITGASKGIGKALALAFAAEGANLLLCSRNETVLNATAKEIAAQYPSIKIKCKAADLSIKTAAQGFGLWVLSQTDSIDILVNNAGLFIPGNVYDEEDGSVEQMMNTNFYSAYHLTRVLLLKMIEKKAGHIFNVCSVASLKAYKDGGSYSISKFALMGFSKNLRQELMPFNIKVTGVYPGAVMTDSWKGFDNSNKRIMEASDIATMVVAASKLTPQAVVEDIVIRPQLGDL
ncbi:SDR family oxidoreductase [Ferruginibacter sp. SUN002]|uniref:SDR family oxidoreductase n=1 Tax=Ferruginibacter sp. SUN002 TaxID=2937789 RepID=UPI003D35F031